MVKQGSSTRRSQERLTSPAEIIIGFLVGGGLACLAILAGISAIREGIISAEQASLDISSNPTAVFIWLAMGIGTALVFTAGFALTARLVSTAKQQRGTFAQNSLPVTGDEDGDEDEQD